MGFQIRRRTETGQDPLSVGVLAERAKTLSRSNSKPGTTRDSLPDPDSRPNAAAPFRHGCVPYARSASDEFGAWE